MATVFLVRSSGREAGGNVIEGIFGTIDQANHKIWEIVEQEPYWRIWFCDEYDLETGKLVELKEREVQ